MAYNIKRNSEVNINYEALSKDVSFALRHHLEQYQLHLDKEGWVLVDDLIQALQVNPKWKEVTVDHFKIMIEKSMKQRHELVDGHIRAFYGHSTKDKVEKIEAIPPKILYHGTIQSVVDIILKDGLKPQKRQYVHLSSTLETAVIVANRRKDEMVILVVDTEAATKDGHKFYKGNEDIWLCDELPAKYLHVSKY